MLDPKNSLTHIWVLLHISVTDGPTLIYVKIAESRSGHFPVTPPHFKKPLGSTPEVTEQSLGVQESEDTVICVTELPSMYTNLCNFFFSVVQQTICCSGILIS